MSRFSRKIARAQTAALREALRRNAHETAEVFSGVYQGPAGLERGIVQVGACDQEIEAERSGDLRKGQPAVVVRTAAGRHAILPAPPAKAGPTAETTIDLTPATIEPPAPEPVTDVAFLVYRQGFVPSRWWLHYCDEDGAFVDQIPAGPPPGPDVHAEPIDKEVVSAEQATGSLSVGWRVAREDDTDIHVMDFFADTFYTRSAPAGRGIGFPSLVGSSLYWIEYDKNTSTPCLSSNTVRLMSSGLDLSSPTEIASGVVANAQLPPSLQGAPCLWGNGIPSRAHEASDSSVYISIFVRGESAEEPSGFVRCGFDDVTQATPAFVVDGMAEWDSSAGQTDRGTQLTASSSLLKVGDTLHVLDMSDIENRGLELVDFSPDTLMDFHVASDRSTIYALVDTGADEIVRMYSPAGALLKSVTLASSPFFPKASHPAQGILAIDPADVGSLP